jgi:hypothetical protein
MDDDAHPIWSASVRIDQKVTTFRLTVEVEPQESKQSSRDILRCSSVCLASAIRQIPRFTRALA